MQTGFGVGQADWADSGGLGDDHELDCQLVAGRKDDERATGAEVFELGGLRSVSLCFSVHKRMIHRPYRYAYCQTY